MIFASACDSEQKTSQVALFPFPMAKFLQASENSAAIRFALVVRR